MKSPKKSENLEVRLSHEDKTTLQKKAALEGRSVSAVVRRLISDYLAPPVTRSKPHPVMELLMTLKSRPKSVLAGLAAGLASIPLLATPFLIPTTASAEEISLSLKGEFVASVEENGEQGQRVRRFNTEIQIGSDHFMTMRLPSLLAQGPDAGLYMVVHVTEAENKVMLGLTLCEVAKAPKKSANVVEMIPIDICKDASVIATPTLTTRFGDKVEFKMGDVEDEIFSFSALPKKL